MISWFYVKTLSDSTKDEAGASSLAICELKKDPRVLCQIYLPPQCRPNACGIQKGSELFCVVDDASGVGAALYCKDDFKYKINADFTINGDLSVSNDISSNGDITCGGDIDASGEISGTDCVCGLISLTKHVHGVVAVGSNTSAPVPTP